MRALATLCALASALAACGAERPPPYVSDDATTRPTDVDSPSPDAPEDALPPPRGVTPYPAFETTVVLPYHGPEQTLDVEVASQDSRLDVHLNVDTSGSFSGEIQSLKRELGAVVIPTLQTRVPDLGLGASRFADFPVEPYGFPTDRAYELLVPISTDANRIRAAVDRLDMPLQHGGDGPEAWLEALWQVATGRGLRNGRTELVPPFVPAAGGGTGGGVGFRGGGARVVVNITDAPSHVPADYGAAVPGTHGVPEVGDALRAMNAHLLGVASGVSARPQLEALAIATGTVEPPTGGRCLTGVNGATRDPVGGACPLVFDILPDGTGLARTIAQAIVRFLDVLVYREVRGRAVDDVGGFVAAVEAVYAAVPPGAAPPARVDRLPEAMPDGVPDTFTDVTTRTRVGFRARLRNERVPEGEYPQLFFLKIQVVGDGAVLYERLVRVIVPDGPKPDAGTDAVGAADAADAAGAG